MIDSAKRFSDDAIYLNEPAREKPKEIFVQFGNLIETLGFGGSLRILDVGCATGKLVKYLSQRFPQSENTGMDVSSAMITQAQQDIPQSRFYTGSALDVDDYPSEKFDVVVSSGVLCIFDDFETPLSHMLSCIRKGGVVLIYTLINDDPVDVIMRYRRSEGEEEGEWEQGWNIVSKQTYEKTLHRLDPSLKWAWHPFEISFPLEKGDDPMRTWTLGTDDKPRQLVNGACQLVNTQFLLITS